MDLQIAKWGNSLALRIPSSVVRELGLRNGDTVHAQVLADGALAIRPIGWSRASFAAELAHARAMLPMGASVVDEMRQAARY
jgi:antitoxin MazE